MGQNGIGIEVGRKPFGLVFKWQETIGNSRAFGQIDKSAKRLNRFPHVQEPHIFGKPPDILGLG